MNFGLIADGNRRWAKSQNLSTKEGHYQGFLTIKDVVLPTLQKSSFTSCTIYCFSTENWKRSPLEVKNLMDLFSDMMDTWLPQCVEDKIKVVHAGRKDRLPKKLLNKIQHIEEETKSFTKFTLYLCLDYGSHDEMIRIVNQYYSKGQTKKLSPQSLQNLLEVPMLDLIVRTGGEQRLSNFCLWQASYAEFHFTPTYLPALTKPELEKIIHEFTNRDRRKGK